MSATPFIITAYALGVVGGVGLSLSEMHWQILDDGHLTRLGIAALALMALLAPWGYACRQGLASHKMLIPTLIAGVVGCCTAVALMHRALNALLDSGPVVECRTSVVDRMTRAGRRRHLDVKLGPCEGFPAGVTVRVREAVFDAATPGRSARFRYHRGAFGSRWCDADAVRFDGANERTP